MSFWSPGTRAVFSQPTPQPFGLPMPIVYERVAEKVHWEYRVITVDLREEPPLDEERMGAIGADGWLLADIVQLPDAREAIRTLIYYFVRQA